MGKKNVYVFTWMEKKIAVMPLDRPKTSKEEEKAFSEQENAFSPRLARNGTDIVDALNALLVVILYLDDKAGSP